MKARRLASSLLVSASLGLAVIAQTPATVPAPAAPVAAPAPAASLAPRFADASAPVPKAGNAAFYEKHAAHLKRARSGPVDLLFLGDSITEGWGAVPQLWQERYGAYNPANFGIGGDHTQHVIWRVEDGVLNGIKPRVVVLMLGTNNSGVHTGAEIAAGDTMLVRIIREKLPETKILLLAIFPRGPRKSSNGTVEDHATRQRAVAEANVALAKLDNGSTIRFLDIGPKFLAADGTIPPEIMPDQLHLSPAGYKIWADAMQPLLDEMLK